MCSMSVAEIRELPGMPPERADVIAAGTLIAARVARQCAVDHMLVSES